MYSVRLGDLLNEFATMVNNGEFKKIPYHDWRLLKKHENEYVRVERDGWGDLNIISINDNEMLSECWPYNDESFGTYLENIYICEFDNCLANKSSQGYYYDSNGLGYIKRDDTGFSATNKIDSLAEKTTPAVEISKEGINIKGKSIDDTIKEIVNEAAGFSINGKENDNMNLFKGFDFGSCENDNVKVSMYGIAVKNANGTWVSYDAKTENVVDVDIFNFNAKYLYKMPVAIKDVKAGDTIIHCRKPVFVTKNENGKILCVDPAAAEEKIVLPVKNMFGFDFVVKIVNLFDGMNGFEAPSADQPFGNNLWMLMMLEDKGNMNDFLPLILLSNNGNGFNPLMLLALSNDKTSSNDLLPLLLLSQTNTFGQTK